MAVETKYICDGCGQDVTYTGNVGQARLHLTAVEMPLDPACKGASTAMYYPWPLKGDLVFCDVCCLQAWSARQ